MAKRKYKSKSEVKRVEELVGYKVEMIADDEVKVEVVEVVNEPSTVEVECIAEGYLMPLGDHVEKGYSFSTVAEEAEKFVKTGKWDYK